MTRTFEHDDPIARSGRSDPLSPAWLDRHRDRVYWYLRFLRCPHDLSEDLTQDALHRGWRNHEPLAGDERTADAWLRTTARNLYFEHLRRMRRRIEFEDTDMLERVWQEEVEADSRRHALGTCLDALGGRARRALEMHYVEGQGREAIGRELGIGVHGVKSMLRRLRQSLKECTERRLR